MAQADSERAEIVRFWHTVEMFSPPSVARVSRTQRVFAVEPGRPLPWDPRHELAAVELTRHQTWRHVVFVGVFPLDAVFGVLSRAFRADPDSVDERPGGESALAAFVVSADGRARVGSEVLSSCAWATGRALDPGPGTPTWLAGFDDARAAFTTAFGDLFADPGPGGAAADETRGRVVGHDDLVACRRAAADAVAAGPELPHLAMRVRSEIVARRQADGADGHDFLNSFVADDLAMVAREVAAGRAGAALREYLRPDADLDTAARRDVREDRETVLTAVSPGRTPLGRWPSSPEQPLALGQQLAVDSALRMLDGPGGVLGVNGPPGTGKTTMLRDLVAALVVERARRLARLPGPDAAFTGTKLRWKTGDYTRVVHELAPALTGFEMVVASANNGAVENVTDEIPAADAIDASWRDEVADLDHFAGIASALLATDTGPGAGERARRAAPDAWALVAARLGNKANRGRFVDAFWYRTAREAGGDAGGEVARTAGGGPARGEPRAPGLQAVLKDYAATPPESTWAEAVAEFTRAARDVEDMRAERERVSADLLRRPAAARELAAAEDALRHAWARLSAARGGLAAAERTAVDRRRDRQERLDRRLEHRAVRPGVLERLTTFGRAGREWRARARELARALAAADDALTAADEAVRRLGDEVERAGRSVTAAETAVARGRRALDELDRSLARARAAFGAHVPDDGWWDDRPRRELAAPWADPAWNRARSGLFLAALRLHKAFLRHAPTRLRQSLHAACDIVRGDVPRDLSPATALAAWQTLFLVVPVVSTTFASFARLFSHLRREALGWLLVDEAGQAAPQLAVGALWRSQRAVLVGDPLQLEPVTTLPFRAEQAIRGDHGVDEQWLTCRTSAQRLADRLTPLGTWLPGDDDRIWVGAPLTVHRRCDQPMFDIVNAIAYDGLMIDGTPRGPGEAFRAAYPRLPDSKWIDVPATVAHGHWAPDEGRELDRILAFLASLRFDMSQVMVVSPFRDVAGRLAARRREHPGLVAGTIHTAQGKQADVVVLVLGGDPARPGALRWAAAKPNLLNVAVSRAKRRLYVVGNWAEWSTLPRFRVLAKSLPRTPARPPGPTP